MLPTLWACCSSQEGGVIGPYANFTSGFLLSTSGSFRTMTENEDLVTRRISISYRNGFIPTPPKKVQAIPVEIQERL